MWQRLEHDNVIPLFGTCDDFGHYASLVCPWFENGSLQRYLARNADELQLAHRLKLVCSYPCDLDSDITEISP